MLCASLGVRTTSLLTGLSVACGATAWSPSAPVALLWASHPTPDRTGPRPDLGRPPCSGRLQGCMDAPRRASPSCPLRETDMQPGAILVLAPGEGADRRRGSGERSGAAVRRTPAPSSPGGCVFCCGFRGHGSSRTEPGSPPLCGAPVRPREGAALSAVVRRPDGWEPASGFNSKTRARLFLASEERHARERPLGSKLHSWR